MSTRQPNSEETNGDGIYRFVEAEKDNWKDIEDPAKWQRWIREGCPLRNEEEDFSEFFEDEEE